MGYVAKFNPLRRRVEIIHEVTGERFNIRLEDPKFCEDAVEELGYEECFNLTLEALASCITSGSDVLWDELREKRKRPFEL